MIIAYNNENNNNNNNNNDNNRKGITIIVFVIMPFSPLVMAPGLGEGIRLSTPNLPTKLVPTNIA